MMELGDYGIYKDTHILNNKRNTVVSVNIKIPKSELYSNSSLCFIILHTHTHISPFSI